jgi:resolvase-like protein
MTAAAIYARVSSAGQAKDQTIGSQLAALREHAAKSRLDVPEEWVFADEGHSGATLARPGLEAGCGTWPPRAAWTWSSSTRRTGWPASSPTRRC